MECTFKVSLVGLGNVGMTAAYAMLLEGTPTDLVLLARDKNKAEGEKIDLVHALPFLEYTNIVATDDYKELAGSDLVVVTAGAAQAPGENRLDLLKKNLAILADIIPKIYENNPNGVVMIVSNPVDILTYHCYKLAPFKPGQVFGTGTMLDSARFRFHLSEIFQVNPRSIHTYILGEHGDTSFPVLSAATIGGQPIASMPQFSAEKVDEAFKLAQNAAYRIIQAKGATFYAIGTVIMTLMKAVYRDSKSVMPLSVPLQDYLGQSDISLSVPCIIGRQGVQQQLKLALSESELQQFNHSAQVLREAYQSAVA
jgi:L-lactate dehydrogenase